MMKRILFSFDSRLDLVHLAGLAVRGICAGSGFPENEVYAMELALCEAVNNTIKHSYKLKPGNIVEVAVELRPDRILFEVANTGERMSHEAFEKVAAEPGPRHDDLPEGGYGLNIIGQVMHEVAYSARHGRNTLTMTRYLPGMAP